MARLVQFVTFGGPETLQVVEVDNPVPGPGEVRVRVKAAGLNPVDYKIFSGGPAAARNSATPPSGNGSDFAGVVDAVGDGVSGWRVGDAVAGGKRSESQADYVVVAADALRRIPAGVQFEVAGALNVAGCTAWQVVASQDPKAGQTALVSAAAGGVGSIIVQLLRLRGVRVIATASAANHDFLRGLGAEPVAYGPGLVGRVRELAPDGIDVVFDQAGEETIRAAIALGVEPAHINTIAARQLSEEFPIAKVGRGANDLTGLAELMQLIADGEVKIPLHASYPLEQVQDAYRELMTRHVRGKIVLTL